MGPGTSSTNHLTGLDPPEHAAEALVGTRGNAHPIPQPDPAAADESALETLADALRGRCVRCRGDLEHPARRLGTGASGRASGGASGRAH